MMTLSRDRRRNILLKPLAVWACLLLLGAVNLGYALIPGMPLKPIVALAIVVAQASLVLAGFMKLGTSSTLVRATALIGIVWLSFLFLLAFADLLTR